MPPPVALRGIALPVTAESLVVVKRGRGGFGIEIVVELHAVNRVVLHHFSDDAGDPVPCFGNARVENKAIAGGADPVTVQDEHAGRYLSKGVVQLGNRRRFGVDRDAVGIKPRVNLHAALVRFIQHKLQRIVARVFADFAGQHIGPRQNIRPPERRTVRFHLEKTVLIPRRCRLSSLAISASFCCVMRLSGVLAIIDPTGGQSRRETVVSHTPRTGSRCACPALTAAAFGGVTRDLGALLVQLNSMPAAMSAAPASATLLAKGIDENG